MAPMRLPTDHNNRNDLHKLVYTSGRNKQCTIVNNIKHNMIIISSGVHNINVVNSNIHYVIKRI